MMHNHGIPKVLLGDFNVPQPGLLPGLVQALELQAPLDLGALAAAWGAAQANQATAMAHGAKKRNKLDCRGCSPQLLHNVESFHVRPSGAIDGHTPV